MGNCSALNKNVLTIFKNKKWFFLVSSTSSYFQPGIYNPSTLRVRDGGDGDGPLSSKSVCSTYSKVKGHLNYISKIHAKRPRSRNAAHRYIPCLICATVLGQASGLQNNIFTQYVFNLPIQATKTLSITFASRSYH